MNGHKIKLVDLFPIHSLYGWGGPDEKGVIKSQAVKLCAIAVVLHFHRCKNHSFYWYCVVCTRESILCHKCIITFNSLINAPSLGEVLAQVTQQEVESAARYILNGKSTNNEILEKYVPVLKATAHQLVIRMRLPLLHATRRFHWGITLVPLQFL